MLKTGKQPKMALQAILVTFAALACAPAWANGGGYSGPDLSGTSIPLKLDRGITLPNARAALYVCLISGDKKLGRDSLTTRFAKQVYGPSVKIEPIEKDFTEVDVIETERIMRGETKELRFAAGQGNCWTGKGYCGLWVSNQVEAASTGFPNSEGALTLRFTRPDFKGEVYATTMTGFPTVVFDELMPDVKFDEWGKPDYNSSVLKGLSIKLAAPISASQPVYSYPVSDRRNNLPTKLNVTLNTAEYVECLQYELQKFAK